MSQDARYRLALVGLALGTLLVAGLVGGAVALASGNETLGTVVIVLIAIGGWSLGYRLRERHRLDLPLWGRLEDEQARRLDDFREYQRTGEVRPRGRSSEQARGTAPAVGREHLSKRDRQRRADVERRRAAAEANDEDDA